MIDNISEKTGFVVTFPREEGYQGNPESFERTYERVEESLASGGIVLVYGEKRAVGKTALIDTLAERSGLNIIEKFDGRAYLADDCRRVLERLRRKVGRLLRDKGNGPPRGGDDISIVELFSSFKSSEPDSRLVVTFDEAEAFAAGLDSEEKRRAARQELIKVIEETNTIGVSWLLAADGRLDELNGFEGIGEIAESYQLG